jgi:DHA2 family methylenomycin A resistance protein-like MFS transporter
MLTGAAVLLIAFLIVEARVAEALLPLQLFKNAVFSSANAAAVLLGFALFGTVFFISQYFQGVQGYSALESGVRTLPSTVGIFIMAPFAGQLAARFSPRVPITLGALLAGTALLLFTRLDPTTDYANIWWNMALFGIGIGLMISPLTAAVLSATPPNRAGLGSSMVNTSRQLGSVFGIALLGALVQSQFASKLTDNFASAGVPAPLRDTLATIFSSAGAQASRVHLPGRLPIPAGTLHSVLGQSFTDALHISFFTAGIALLLAGLLAVALLRPKRPAAEPQPEAAQSESEAEPIVAIAEL